MPIDPEHLLAQLDPDQRVVATTFGRPVAVIAGAGSGKTRAISHRIAYGAAVGAYAPEAVLAVTFTTRAAGELRGRLRALGVPRVQARTFHSAALRQAQYFWPAVYASPLPSVADNRIGMVADAAGRLLGGRAETGQLRDLATEISWAKVSNVLPADYAEAAAEAGREVERLDPTAVGRIYARYEVIKADRGVIDFDDVLLCAVAVLSDEAGVLTEVRRAYRHLIVDEYQDVSPLQQQLLDLWGGPTPDLCVVGDPAQTIHSFAGARPGYLTGFALRHREAAILTLDRDYRSTPQVVAVANRLLARPAAGAAGVLLRAMRPDGPPAEFSAADDEAAEAKGVADWLAAQAAAGVPYPEMAVLYRIHAQSPTYEAALAQAGIPYTMRGADGFFDRPEVREALARLRAPSADVAQGSVAEALRGVLAALGWQPDPPTGQGAARERWESLAALAALVEQFQRDHPEATLSQLRDELATRAASEHAPAGAGVSLGTLHGAKGLEWEAVAIVGVQDGTIPFVLASSPEQLVEERRLLYVGVTRARSRLRISWAATRNGGGARRPPSRFLDGIRPEASGPSPRVGRRPRQRTLVGARCLRCGGPLSGGAEAKVGRHLDCEPGYDPHTWELLSEWRRQEAESARLPAFVIFTDATLMAIAERRPDDLAGLLRVPGVGRVKAERYGEAVLALLGLPATSAKPGNSSVSTSAKRARTSS